MCTFTVNNLWTLLHKGGTRAPVSGVKIINSTHAQHQGYIIYLSLILNIYTSRLFPFRYTTAELEILASQLPIHAGCRLLIAYPQN